MTALAIAPQKTAMVDVRPLHSGVPASWRSAGIVDARAFRIGNAETVHGLSHASPNKVRGLCGVIAHVSERDSRLASWADAFPNCPTCKS